jgi:undecaprenyl phosphate-alpha-L-ara4FN deformylase
MRIGLRIDVDTLRGTRLGVPELCRILSGRGIRASFFLSVGPDNMGRHLWRLARPAFLAKMLRSRAASLYGWDVVLRGTLWPGPVIGERLERTLHDCAEHGHEIGLHAWDHHQWQAHAHELSPDRVRTLVSRGCEAIERITGSAPTAFASPGWVCDEAMLATLEEFPFRYQSDCRGSSIFLPEIAGRPGRCPQIPVTLPTYDEAVGRDGVTDANWEERLLELLDPSHLCVLCIHAEVEGISRARRFADFLDRAMAEGWSFTPLGDLLDPATELSVERLEQRVIPGREGLVAGQGANRL